MNTYIGTRHYEIKIATQYKKEPTDPVVE